jgi:hypothetical protein
VETNAPPADDPYWLVPNWTLYVTVYEQAAFIPQALASALAAGAERVAVFKLMDVDGDRAANPEPFGLLRQDSSRRPAYDSYRVAIGQLAGVATAVRQRWDAVGQFRLDQGDQTTTVLFTRLPFEQEAKVLATSETAELVDMWGKARTVTADNGVYRVTLPPALCVQTIGDYCMIGGTVYYLVQGVDERPAGTRPAEDGTATARPTTTATAVATTVALTETAVAPSTTPPPPTPEAPPTETATAEIASPAPVAVVLPTVTPRAAPTAESGAARSDGAGSAPVNGLLLIGAGLVGALALGGWVLHGRRSR